MAGVLGEKGIKVVCKKCGRNAMSNEFVLDSVFRMMVCPNCIRDRRAAEMVHSEVKRQKEEKKKQQEEDVDKPAGWDAEDEYLDRIYKAKMKHAVKVERVDKNRVKYTCPKCSYKFIYDESIKKPSRCPYCSSEVNRMFF